MRRLFFCAALALCVLPASGQKLAKYGADFLAGGAGGRALGMGAAVALTQDVASGYWNAAGLSGLAYPELGYLHAERFAGIVSFDYAAAAMPLSGASTVGLSYFRSGVNDIKNTLDAWDAERDQPRANYEGIRTFSAADHAFFLSYARSLSRSFSVGVTGKLIRRSIGDFAEAWGYSFDVGAQTRVGRIRLGANLQDVAGMYQSWSVNPDAFTAGDDVNPQTGQPYTFQEAFGQELPQGGTYVVPPVARLGAGYDLPLGGALTATLGADLDLAFDNQRAYAFNAGRVSMHPRVGTELGYRGVVAFRAGLSRIEPGEDGGVSFSPVLGAGLTLQQFSIDYGFGDFAGMGSELGQTHRISARLVLRQSRLARGE
jgi:hypothetical protein